MTLKQFWIHLLFTSKITRNTIGSMILDPDSDGFVINAVNTFVNEYHFDSLRDMYMVGIDTENKFKSLYPMMVIRVRTGSTSGVGDHTDYKIWIEIELKNNVKIRVEQDNLF